MSALAEKLRRARQSRIEIDGRKFVITRPTDADAASLGGMTMVEIICRFVVGWDGMTELDLGLPGGTGAPVDFSADVFGEWIVDQPQCWAPMAEAIVGAYKAHAEKREAAEKN